MLLRNVSTSITLDDLEYPPEEAVGHPLIEPVNELQVSLRD